MNGSVPPASHFDVVVIGAGAAGIAAGRRLAETTLAFCILEARPRLGGRAYTRIEGGFPLDLGCGWLHSADRNPWSRLIEARGFTIDRTPPSWRTQAFDLGFDPQSRQEFDAASAEFYRRLETAADDPRDRPAAELLEPGCRWNALIGAISTYVNGVELERVSVHDFGNYADSGVNWRVLEGYGAAIAALGADLPVHLDCPVTLIDHAGPRLRLETPHGTVAARAVIITVPPPLIGSAAIRFDPPLPAKLDAAASLPLGLADKLVMSVAAAADLPKDGHLFGRTDRVATAGYYLRPFGRRLIEAYFAGALAQGLEEAGPGAFFAFAADELASLFGSAIRPRLRPLSTTAWRHDPFARGSYSYALPGHSAARASLAAPVDDRLFFAGEACSTHDFSTAHGAYKTGVAAAELALAALAADERRIAASP